jgi:hypothetical protein
MIDHVQVLIVLNQCKASGQVNDADKCMFLDDFSEVCILCVSGLITTGPHNLPTMVCAFGSKAPEFYYGCKMAGGFFDVPQPYGCRRLIGVSP